MPRRPPRAAPADTSVHKHHGMFGKLKSVAENKTVQNVAKAAACQALPGGQYMVAAAEAANDKKSITSGVANSQSCIPGMGGMSGGRREGARGCRHRWRGGGAARVAVVGGMTAAQIAAAGSVRGMPNGEYDRSERAGARGNAGGDGADEVHVDGHGRSGRARRPPRPPASR